MKKSDMRFFIVVLVLLAATSCQKEEIRTLKATFEQFESGSKAYIDEDYYSCWEANDAVAINGTSCAVTLATGNSRANSAEIVVPTTLNGQNLLAFYPADKISDMSATGGTVDFPHVQTYEERDGHQFIDNPMAAYCPSDGNELRFRNLGSLLKVTITANHYVKAIQVKGVDNQMLCGKARLLFDNQNEPMLGTPVDGYNSVTLRFPTAVRANGKSFYIVLPPNTNFETLTVAVLSGESADNLIHRAKTSTLGRGLTRNHIAAISYDLSHEDYDFVADWTIRYTATAQVDPYTAYMDDHIAYHNFSGSKGLIVFDDVITKVSHFAYRDKTNLQSITFPVSVTEVGLQAFYRCNALTAVSLPYAATIEESAFELCNNLTAISLPNATTIGNFAFCDCDALTSVSLPNATTIGNFAFCDCDALTSISLPKATTIEAYTFANCTHLTSISLPNATTIGDFAFSDCVSLTTVSLPSATSIGDYAFSSCSSLAAVTIPQVTSMEYMAFGHCTNLSNVYSTTAAPTLGGFVFEDVPSTAVLHLPSSLEGSASVTWSGWPGEFAYDYDD